MAVGAQEPNSRVNGMVVVVTFGSGEAPPLPPGVLPGIVLDISITENQHHLVELMLHSPQLNCVLLVVLGWITSRRC